MEDILDGYKKSFTLFGEGIGNLLLLSFIHIAFIIGAGVLVYMFMIITGATVPVLISASESLDPNIATILIILVVTLAVGLLVFFYAAIILVGVVAQGGMMYLVKDLGEGKKQGDAFDYIKKAWDVKWKLLGTGLLLFLFVALGFLLFILPGIIASFLLSLAIYAVVFEGLSGMDAIRRSYELVKRNIGGYLGRFFLLYVAGFVIGGAASFLPFAGFALQLFAGGFIMCYIYVLYIDMAKSIPVKTK